MLKRGKEENFGSFNKSIAILKKWTKIKGTTNCIYSDDSVDNKVTYSIFNLMVQIRIAAFYVCVNASIGRHLLTLEAHTHDYHFRFERKTEMIHTSSCLMSRLQITFKPFHQRTIERKKRAHSAKETHLICQHSNKCS